MTTQPKQVKRKDLSALYAPPLVLLTRAGEEVRVNPPSHKDMLIMQAFYKAQTLNAQREDVCPTCGRVNEGSDISDYEQVWRDNADRDIEEIALGAGVYETLKNNGTPASDIVQMAYYAMVYWMLGEQAADALLEQAAGRDPWPNIPGADDPKD